MRTFSYKWLTLVVREWTACNSTPLVTQITRHSRDSFCEMHNICIQQCRSTLWVCLSFRTVMGRIWNRNISVSWFEILFVICGFDFVTVIVCISIRITGTWGKLAQTQIRIFSSSNAISFSLPGWSLHDWCSALGFRCTFQTEGWRL